MGYYEHTYNVLHQPGHERSYNQEREDISPSVEKIHYQPSTASCSLLQDSESTHHLSSFSHC